MLTCFRERRMQRQQAMCAKPKPEMSKWTECCGVPGTRVLNTLLVDLID